MPIIVGKNNIKVISKAPAQITFRSLGKTKVITKCTHDSGLPDAPADGNTYGRKDESWVTVGGIGAGLSGICGESIGVFRIVKRQADNKLYIASNQDEINMIVGLSMQSGAPGNPINYKVNDEITDSAFSGFVIGSALFLNDMGQLVAVPPASGWLIQLATVVAPSKIKININTANAALIT